MAKHTAARKHGDDKQTYEVEQDGRLERTEKCGGEVTEDQHEERGEEGGKKLSHHFPVQH